MDTPPSRHRPPRDRPWRDGAGPRASTRFGLILAAFLALLLASWPILFSFQLWVFKDRGNLLNLDLLLDRHLRLGVDTFYSYGLLPVALQRLAFAAGRGYLPMVACTVASAVGLALILASIARHLPASRAWLAALLCLTPILLWVNPNFPYSLVLLSMLAGIALVLAGRLDLALLAASFGCWSVPSLPLVLVAVLLALILAAWWRAPPRRPAALLRAIAPGLAAYLATGAGLALAFGWRSVLATALPFQGSAFYAAKGYGFASLLEFLSPAGAGPQWYLGTRATWWLASTALLAVLAVRSSLRLARRRQLRHLDTCVVILAILHAAFIFVAPGPSAQHLVYDPLLAVGVLLALATLPPARPRMALLAGLGILGLLGCTWQARDTWRAWRTERIFPDTAGLYADPAFAAQWSRILDLARGHPVFFLARATGIHHYFPAISGPQVWFLDIGQTLPADDDRVFAQMAAADIVVEEPESLYAGSNARVRSYLDGLCPRAFGRLFRVRQKPDAARGCAAAPPP